MNQDLLDDQLLDTSEHKVAQYAGFGIRLGAMLLDFVVFVPIVAFSLFNHITIKSMALALLIPLIQSLYKPLMEWRYGATLGKMACRIKVVNYDLQDITAEQSFFRAIPWLLTAFPGIMTIITMYANGDVDTVSSFVEFSTISATVQPWTTINYIIVFLFYIFVGSFIFDSKKQGFHDKTAKTYCIKKRIAS